MRALHEPFHDAGRQCEADRLGMLVFLASEIMLFGGIFTAGLVLRVSSPEEYAGAAHHLKLWLGTVNTAVLLTSSLCAALGVEASRQRRHRSARLAIAATIVLGLIFLGIKAFEYREEFHEGLLPGTASAHFASRFEQLFMNFYLLATGLHGLHVIVGLALLTVAMLGSRSRGDAHAVLIGNAALYWHLVDIVWIFLFPTLYLAGVS